MTNAIKKVVIVGGGTAGWISAACLSKVFFGTDMQITLIESPQINTVGVGEATIPPIVNFIHFLGIDERDFIKNTQATFKLGIQFQDWCNLGEHYWHQFGSVGANIDGLPFYQHWLKSKLQGNRNTFTDYSPAIAMAKKNKFVALPESDKSVLSGSRYAWHFDATLVAKYLAQYAKAKGVVHKLAHVENVFLKDDGFINSVKLVDGEEIAADFFIDCTGFEGLLIEKTLKTGYEDWTHFLPNDSAIVAQTSNSGESAPYTRAKALSAGWQWRIPLQHRTGNGYVFCSRYTSDQEAEKLFKENLAGELLTTPRIIRFKTGKRKKIWNKNCLSVGLSSGFLEPLESTSIHLIMQAVMKFMEMFPSALCELSTQMEYNRVMNAEYESIRDFIVLHYCTTQRTDSDYWNFCRTMNIPDTLKLKIDLFKSQGRLYKNEFDLFSHNSWYAVLEGMKIRPHSYDPLIDLSNSVEVKKIFDEGLSSLESLVARLPTHEEFIKDNCSAQDM